MSEDIDALFSKLENSTPTPGNAQQSVDDSDALFAKLESSPKQFTLPAPDIMPKFEDLSEAMTVYPDASSKIMSGNVTRESFEPIFKGNRLSRQQRDNLAGVMNQIKNIEDLKGFVASNPDIAKQLAQDSSVESFQQFNPNSNYSEQDRKYIAKNLSDIIAGKDPTAELKDLYVKQNAREIFRGGGSCPSC